MSNLLRVNSKDTRTTPMTNFGQISDIVLLILLVASVLFLFLTSKGCPGVELTVCHLKSARHLSNFEALKCGVYWRAVRNRGRYLFKVRTVIQLFI